MTTSKRSALISTFGTLLGLVVLALPSTASAFSAAGDFSTSSNPNGPWSYGWSYGVGSTFHLDTIHTNNYFGLGLGAWLSTTNTDGRPYLLYNGTAGPLVNGNTTYQPGQLAEEGGDSNEVGVVRWTAPFSGTFSINTTFAGMSSAGDSSDVHILHDGVSIFNATVIGTPNPTSYSGLQNIVAGDTIDFVVGNNGNGPFDDNTLLLASIVSVPEPGTFGLVGMGLGCLLSFRFLKRK